jgi:hypothetical protein
MSNIANTNTALTVLNTIRGPKAIVTILQGEKGKFLSLSNKAMASKPEGHRTFQVKATRIAWDAYKTAKSLEDVARIAAFSTGRIAVTVSAADGSKAVKAPKAE